MAVSRKRYYTDLEVVSIFMQDGSDDEESVVRPYHYTDEVDPELLEAERDRIFIDMYDEEANESLDLDSTDQENNSTTDTASEAESVPDGRSQLDREWQPARSRSRTDSDAPPSPLPNLDLPPMPSEADDEEEDYMSEMTKNLTDFPLVPPFTGNSGYQVERGESPTPFHFYSLFITHDLIKRFKSQTNTHTRQKINEKLNNRDANVSQRHYMSQVANTQRG